MINDNQVVIETMVALQEAQQLIEFYRNRNLILAQSLYEMERRAVNAETQLREEV